MPLIETNTRRKYFRNAESMMLVPYVYDDDESVKDYVLGDDIYDISAVIADSILIEQKDGDVDEKFNEFVNIPVVRNTTAGSYDFTAQCLDLQDNVLRSLFGARTATGTNGNVEGVVVLPEEYQLMYAMIYIRFKSENIPDVILPKVQMNNKLLLSQMSSRGSQGNIGGIALPRMVAVIDSKSASDMLLEFGESMSGEPLFAPVTPVFFVPRNEKPLFYHHYEDVDKCIFSSIEFSEGVVSHNISVNIREGTYEKLF